MRQGAFGAGDGALALAISKARGCRISQAYLATNITVLLLSLTYISFGRIIFSLITVCISSPLIEFVQNVGRKDASLLQQVKTPVQNGLYLQTIPAVLGHIRPLLAHIQRGFSFPNREPFFLCCIPP
ncbi:MAG: YitT family protein [Oscillospiraceae bacterium]